MLRAATFARKSGEERVDLVLFGAAVDVAQVVDKFGPVVIGGALEQLVELSVVTACKLAFKKCQFVLGLFYLGSSIRIFDAGDPLLDVLFI